MEVGQHTTTPAHRLVAELRRSNDARWERLKDLYDRASRLADSGEDGEVKNSSHVAVRRMQGELDFLPRTRWARESEEMVQMIERELAMRADASESKLPAEDTAVRIVEHAEDLWHSEIVSSYKNTKQMNTVLRQEIERERDNLRQLQVFRDETKEIHAELVEENRTLQQEAQASSRVIAANGRVHQSGASPDVDSLYQMLRSDLSYFAQSVDSQLLTRNSDSDDEDMAEDAWTLDELLLRLVSMLLRRHHLAGTGTARDPDNARMLDLESVENRRADAMSALSTASSTTSSASYLSIEEHPVRTEHVELLLNCCIVETHRDDESLIRLVDYRR